MTSFPPPDLLTLFLELTELCILRDNHNQFLLISMSVLIIPMRL